MEKKRIYAHVLYLFPFLPFALLLTVAMLCYHALVLSSRVRLKNHTRITEVHVQCALLLLCACLNEIKAEKRIQKSEVKEEEEEIEADLRRFGGLHVTMR